MPINFLKKIIQQEKTVSDDEYWMKKSPSKACVDYIESFYSFYDINSETEHWIFNDGFPTIILFPEKNNKVCIDIDGKENIIKSGWVDAGVIKKAYVRYIENFDYILIVRFRPECFYKLFKLNPSFFKSRNIASLADIDFDIELSNEIFAADSIEKKIDVIESYVKNLIPINTKTGLLNSAIELINQTKGQISVANVIREVGVNYKWLERNFSKHLGFTPKEYIQLQRFLSAYINMYNEPHDLLDIAITNGYYDYNHFLKEFKGFTGKTPIEYISKK